jgi:Protein of unknown function (DUF2975)
MGNLLKIKRLSRQFYLLTSLLLVVIPCYYVGYWMFINLLPSTLVNVNVAGTSLIPHSLPVKFQLIGYAASLLPLAALFYGLTNLRRLFALYREGVFFSFEQVTIFRKISKALFAWVLFSMLYESAKSILFSIGNPPGERVVSLTFGSSEITNLLIAGVVFVIAWIMDEGRILAEEQQLTV